MAITSAVVAHPSAVRARQLGPAGHFASSPALTHGNRPRRKSLGLSRQSAAIVSSIRRHWRLILSLTRRDLAERFQGSLLGPLWFVITPAILILTYTLVFGMVFKVKVPFARASDTSNLEFGLFLFSGLLIFTVFSDVVSRSTSLIVSRPNFVKKVVFPLEILSMVTVLSALAGGLLSFVLLVVAATVISGDTRMTSFLYLGSLLLLTPMLIGLSWFLSAVGTYMRDIAQIIGLLLTVLLFLSPVFTPLSGFPPLVQVPPAQSGVRADRARAPDVFSAPNAARLVGRRVSRRGTGRMWLGWAFFQKTRSGFADVL